MDQQSQQNSAPNPQLPRPSLRPVHFALTLMFGVLLGVGGYAGYQELTAATLPTQQEISEPSPSPADEAIRREALPLTNVLSPTQTTTKSVRVTILDTSSWMEYQCSRIAFKIPANTYSQRCTQYQDGSREVSIRKKDQEYVHAEIQIRTYNGRSRRQYRIQSQQATPEEVTTYMRFQETMFGDVSGLDVFESDGWWQGGYTSPIMIAKETTLVLIYGGRNFDDQTGKITRWDFTDTIASTIRFL